MDAAQIVAVLGVASAWTVFAFTLRRWGPGRAKRSVRCPVKNVRAKLHVVQEESDFGRLRMADVTACSLYPHEPLACSKECLARF